MVAMYHPTVPNGPLEVPDSQAAEWVAAGWRKSPIPAQEDKQPSDK